MRVFVAGHRGLVGSAVCRLLERDGQEVVTTPDNLARIGKIRLDTEVDAIVMAAALVGGIGMNIASPQAMLQHNLAIQRACFDFAVGHSIQKLVFLGSTCVYPRDASWGIEESELMTGPLEPTNQSYALAKLVGLEEVRLARGVGWTHWTALMPANLYGPGDNFNLERAHACAAILRKVQRLVDAGNAKAGLELWGVPWTIREWLYAEDLADAIVTVLYSEKPPQKDFYNVGSGEAIRMDWLVNRIQNVVGVHFEPVWDTAKPSGAPSRSLNSRAFRTEFGWYPRTQLDLGLKQTWEWMQANKETMRQ